MLYSQGHRFLWLVVFLLPILLANCDSFAVDETRTEFGPSVPADFVVLLDSSLSERELADWAWEVLLDEAPRGTRGYSEPPGVRAIAIAHPEGRTAYSIWLFPNATEDQIRALVLRLESSEDVEAIFDNVAAEDIPLPPIGEAS